MYFLRSLKTKEYFFCLELNGSLKSLSLRTGQGEEDSWNASISKKASFLLALLASNDVPSERSLVWCSHFYESWIEYKRKNKKQLWRCAAKTFFFFFVILFYFSYEKHLQFFSSIISRIQNQLTGWCQRLGFQQLDMFLRLLSKVQPLTFSFFSSLEICIYLL